MLQYAVWRRCLRSPLVKERQKIVLRATLLVSILRARPRGGGRGQVARTVQKREEIVRVHVVQTPVAAVLPDKRGRVKVEVVQGEVAADVRREVAALLRAAGSVSAARAPVPCAGSMLLTASDIWESGPSSRGYSPDTILFISGGA